MNDDPHGRGFHFRSWPAMFGLMTMKRPIARLFAFLAMLFLFNVPAGLAQDNAGAGSVPADGASMVIATRNAPPFSMQGPDGEWDGLAIDLWRDVAEKRGYDYRFVEADLADLVDGLQEGKYDASVGALTITADREQQVDFTHPFFSTGFGIAVRDGGPDWLSLLGGFFSMGFLMGVLPLIAVLAFVGLLFWLAERRHNEDEFPRDVRGLGSGFWFSAVTMTTVGYGDKAPRSAAGKIVALVWMFTALIITSTFTGMLASSLTAGRLGGDVAGPSDLADKSVGVIGGSAAEQWLAEKGIAPTVRYDNLDAGMAAVSDGDIDAFVHDDPLMRYARTQGMGEGVRLLQGTYGRQEYGIALQPRSPLRETINRALLEYVESDDWQADLTRALGSDG